MRRAGNQSRKRRWLERLGWVLLALLWLFVTALVAGDSATGGIAVLVAGVIYFAAEAWIARHGEAHQRFVIAWRLTWRAGLGASVIVLSAVRDHTTPGLVFGVAAGCLIAVPPLGIAAFLWLLDRRATAPSETD